MAYDTDYPSEPIGGDNPYWCCSICKKSHPEINGQIENHASWCSYRIRRTAELPPKNVKTKTFNVRT